jgi:hypothetical protein
MVLQMPVRLKLAQKGEGETGSTYNLRCKTTVWEE